MSDFCGPMDCSRTGSFVHGISQARILKWVAKSYSRGSSRPRDRTSSLVGRFLPLAPHRTQIYKHAYICTYIYTHTHIYIYTIKSLKAQPPKLMRVIIVIPIISLVTQGWLNVTLWGRNRLILFHMWWGQPTSSSTMALNIWLKLDFKRRLVNWREIINCFCEV